jgi:hypothetical protein
MTVTEWAPWPSQRVIGFAGRCVASLLPAEYSLMRWGVCLADLAAQNSQFWIYPVVVMADSLLWRNRL